MFYNCAAGYIMTEEEKEQAMETGLLVFSKEVFGIISSQII